MNPVFENLVFEKINCSTRQIRELYQMIGKRIYGISHAQLPAYKDHKHFVIQNPYRVWYLIKDQNKCLGSFYITDMNSVGLNLTIQDEAVVKVTLDFVRNNYQPYSEIKSVRPNYFYANIPVANSQMQFFLETLGCQPMQVSFKL